MNECNEFPLTIVQKNFEYVSEEQRRNKKEYNTKSAKIEVEMEEIEERLKRPKWRRQCNTEKWAGRGGAAGFVAFVLTAMNSGFSIGIIVGLLIWAGGWCFGYYMFQGEVSSDHARKKALKQELEDAKANLFQKNKQVKDEADQKLKEYTAKFNQQVQEKSAEFSESKLCEQIALWAFELYAKEIDNADRSSSEKDIKIFGNLCMYEDHVEFNDNVFDFKKERVQNITMPIEQMAIIRVIATKLNLQIVMKYPQDLSGTENKVRLDYNDNVASVTVRYYADNGNYIAESAW